MALGKRIYGTGGRGVPVPSIGVTTTTRRAPRWGRHDRTGAESGIAARGGSIIAPRSGQSVQGYQGSAGSVEHRARTGEVREAGGDACRVHRRDLGADEDREMNALPKT